MKETDPRPTGLFEQFARLSWAMHRYHQQNHRLHGPMADPHRGQGRILALLKMNPEITQKELSFLLDMRPQSLGELLMKLERSGYITRTASETDRRLMEIKLTEAGLQATEPDKRHSQFTELFDCLSAEEQSILGGYLRRLSEKLEEKLQLECETDPACHSGHGHGGGPHGHFGRHEHDHHPHGCRHNHDRHPRGCRHEHDDHDERNEE